MLPAGLRNCQRARHHWPNRWRSNAFALLYGPAARWYDLFTSWLFQGEWARWQTSVLTLLPDAGLIVELGSGTGQLAARGRRHDREWIAIEPSGAMIAAARRKNQHHRYCLVRGAAQRVPLRDESADAIVVVFPGPYIRDPATVEEITRVIKAHGIVVVAISRELAADGIGRRLRCIGLRLFYGPPASHGDSPFSLPGIPGACKRLRTRHGAVEVFVGTVAGQGPTIQRHHKERSRALFTRK